MNLKHIGICFFKLFYPNKTPPKKHLKKILKEGEYLTNRGWTVSNITNRLVKLHKDQPDINIKSLFQIIKKTKTPPLKKDKNILKDKFYYHSILQKTSSPTKIVVDDDNGKIIRKTEPFYLENIECFTLKHLTKYFHKEMKIKDKNLLRLNYGGFRKIINDYDLDLLLFTINVSKKELINNDRKLLKNYSQLFNYTDEGIKRLKQAKNLSSNKVVPYYKSYIKKNNL